MLWSEATLPDADMLTFPVRFIEARETEKSSLGSSELVAEKLSIQVAATSEWESPLASAQS